MAGFYAARSWIIPPLPWLDLQAPLPLRALKQASKRNLLGWIDEVVVYNFSYISIDYYHLFNGLTRCTELGTIAFRHLQKGFRPA